MKYKVKTLHAFGSVCTNNFKKNSDVDFLISFKPIDYGNYADTYFQFTEALEKVLNRHEDLVTEKSLGNPYYIETLNKTKPSIIEA